MKSIKRLLAVAIVIAMMVSCFAISASAKAKDLDIWVGGVRVNSYNAVNGITGDNIQGTVTYDKTTNTLTLDNAVIKAAITGTTQDNEGQGFTYGIYARQDITIKVVGDSKITIAKNDKGSIENYRWFGISTFNGYSDEGNITIESDNASRLSIVADFIAPDESQTQIGICGDAITIDGAKVGISTTGTPGSETAEDIICVYTETGTITLKNDAYLDIDFNGALSGVLTEGNINIEDSTCKVSNTCYGIYSYKNIVISGTSDINITSKLASINASDTITFKDTVNVNCTTTGDDSCVLANDEIIFDLDKGGIVTAETKSESQYFAAFLAAAPSTIKLNREDGTTVTYPTGGKETKLAENYWVITESDGSTNAKKATVENELIEYAIKETGTDATWTKGGTVGQKITSTADFSKFVSVSVDGKVVDAANYDKAEGSTIITFKPAYLETLAVGDHPVVITSTDGTATGVLTIKEAAKEEAAKEEPEKVADTADNSAIATFVALGTLAAAGFVTLKKKEN